VAAELASGRLTLDAVGRRLSSLVSAGFPVVARAEFAEPGVVVEGVVVTVDRFGNLITNIGVPSDVASTASTVSTLMEFRVEVEGVTVPVGGTYADVAVGAHVALINAFDVLEIAQRDGDAARSLGLGRGARVRLRRPD
jgi:S-adenosylmethionine hydrolase